LINIRHDFKLENKSMKVKNTKENEQINSPKNLIMNINLKGNNQNDFNNFEFEFKDNNNNNNNNINFLLRKNSNLDEKSSNNNNENEKEKEMAMEYSPTDCIMGLKKKNQYNVNISNSKSPRFFPLKVMRPIEAYKGNFLNDFHKNFKLSKEKDSRFIESFKNSVNSHGNYDVSSLNKLSSNIEKDKNSSYKYTELLPLINSPISNNNKIDYNENVQITESRINTINQNNERKIFFRKF